MLVASSCCPHAITACLASTWLGAVQLAVITAPAHPQLMVTTGTIQHSVAALDDRRPSSPQKAGQALAIASLSAPEQALFDDRADLHRRLEAATSGLHLFGARLSYRDPRFERNAPRLIESK